MFYLKSCLKCKGDMYLEQDMYGPYRRCLQCGQLVEPPNSQVLLAGKIGHARLGLGETASATTAGRPRLPVAA